MANKLQRRFHMTDTETLLVPDESVVTNEAGGKQSYIGTRFDLLPPTALDNVAQVLYAGSIKYGDENWRLIPVHEHVNHALRHLIHYLALRNTEDLSHATCRALFALELHLNGKRQ